MGAVTNIDWNAISPVGPAAYGVMGQATGAIFAGSSQFAGGVKADGTTNDSAAIKAVFAEAVRLAALGMRGTIWLPAGDIICDATCQNLYAPSGWTVQGAGRGVTRLKWTSPQTGGTTRFIGITLARSNVTYRDFSIVSDHGAGGDFTSTGDYPFYEQNVTDLLVENVEVTRSRIMALVGRGCNRYRVLNCYVHENARDGINFADCWNGTIANNEITRCDDDGIAVHTQIYNIVDQGTVIAGNRVWFSQGIKVLGAVSAIIANNNVQFFMGQGIAANSLADTGGIEGANASNGCIISSNVLCNPIDRRYVDALNSGAPYIRIGGDADQAGTAAAIPGEADSITGAVEEPYDYFVNNSSGSENSGLPIPANYNYVISGNICNRTIGALTNISDLGLGTFYTRNGPQDPAITATYLRQSVIEVVDGIVRNVSVNGNTAMGVGFFLYLAGNNTVCKGWNVSSNLVLDANSHFAAVGGNSKNHDIVFSGDRVNLDPFHAHANRGAAGGWLADGGPTAELIQNAKGLTFENCIYANLCRVSDKSTFLGVSGDVANFKNCTIYGIPAVSGFSTSNNGIGNWPTNGDFVLEARRFDPNGSAWGDRLNSCPKALSAAPTSGYYAAGHFIQNTGAGNTAFYGWIRRTFGNDHADGIDWYAVVKGQLHVRFNGTLASPTIIVGLGVSSVTKNTTGDYTLTLVNASPVSTRTVAGTVNGAGFVYVFAESATTVRIRTVDHANVLTDYSAVMVYII